jgi:serine/threonine protein kinase
LPKTYFLPASASEFKNRVPDAMLGISRALKYLHCTKGIVYRDLKPANIGFTENGMVKLFDFDLARHESECKQQSEIAGTMRYLAPECLSKCAASCCFSSDVYSFGVVLFEVATLEIPYSQLVAEVILAASDPVKGCTLDDFEKAFARKLSLKDDGGEEWRHSLDSEKCSSVKVQGLIRDCWDPRPSRRPGFEQICGVMEDISLDCNTASKQWVFEDSFWVSQRKKFGRSLSSLSASSTTSLGGKKKTLGIGRSLSSLCTSSTASRGEKKGRLGIVF